MIGGSQVFKRNHILIIGLIILLAIMSYIISINNNIEEPLDSNGIKNNEDLNTPAKPEPALEEPLPIKEARYISQLKFAYEGRMDKTKPIIGKNVEQYLDDNFDSYYFLGGLAHDNGEIQLLTNGYLDYDDNSPVYGDVIVIVKKEAYDIKMGMTMDKVKNGLGEPDEIVDYSLEYDESELYGSHTIFEYETGEYVVVIVFDSLDKTVIAVHLNGSKNNPGYPTSEGRIDLLALSQEELDAYNRFKSNYNEEELRGLEPISLMRLYLHATIEHDLESQWELYIKEENYLGWDKEYHLSEFANHRKREFSEFENAVNIDISYEEDDINTAIVWEDKYLEEYDSSGYPFKFTFGLVKNKDGIWKVSFLPMQ